MNSETYQELFHYVTFPVFATAKNGRVVYKNLACSKYLPEIYRSTGIKNKIYPEFPQESKPVRVLGGSSYSNALAVMDGEHIVFLGFSRFQCADGVLVAERILNKWGNNLLDLLVGFKQMVVTKKYNSLSFCFEDEELFSFIQEDIGFWGCGKYSLPSVLNPVFSRLNESFGTIGYCFSAKTEKDFPEYLPVQIEVNDLLFLLGKLIYLTMKFSATCRVDIVLFSEIAYSRHRLRIETPTNFKKLPQTKGNNALLLEELIPEYAAEIHLLDQSGLLGSSDFSVHIDALGTLSVTCNFPYQEPDWTLVQSMNDFSLPMLGNIENMIHSIMMKIKDKDSFC